MLHVTTAQFLDSSITAVTIFGLGFVISAWKSVSLVATIAPVATPVEATPPVATPVEIAPTTAHVATPVEATPTVATPVEATPTVATPVAKTPKTSVGELRKLCTAQNIEWRNVRGNNKHLGKAAMLLALAS